MSATGKIRAGHYGPVHCSSELRSIAGTNHHHWFERRHHPPSIRTITTSAPTIRAAARVFERLVAMDEQQRLKPGPARYRGSLSTI